MLGERLLSGQSGDLAESTVPSGSLVQYRNIRHVMTLELNPSSAALTSDTDVDVTLEVFFGDTEATLTRELKTLQVNYRESGEYVAMAALSKENVLLVRYRLLKLSVRDATGEKVMESGSATNAFSGTPYRDLIDLKQQLSFDKYVKPDPLQSVDRATITINSDGKVVRVAWSRVQWAWFYDIEISFSDDYTKDNNRWLLVSRVPYDFRFNSTRIQVTEPFLEIPLVYESGYLTFRVRPVGYWGVNLDKVVNGQWSVTSNSGFIGGVDRRSVFKIDTSVVHESDRKNWQLISTFAEESKRKDAVTYLDGTLRNRQTVVSEAAEKILLASETIYDFNGRPAIDVLPVPIATDFVSTPKIQFQNQLHRNASGKTYSRADFDRDRQCISFPEVMAPTSGAGLYYSKSNRWLKPGPGNTLKMSFVPDAEGFPFTQKEYTPDNTGRLRRTGNAGKELNLGAGHTQKYYYGVPSQQELDRIFGYDIGYSSHYRKEVSIDENGQSHITYRDLKGKVVATSLAGPPPLNVAPLNEREVAGTEIKVDIVKENTRIDSLAGTFTATYSLIIPTPTTVNLDYSLTKEAFRSDVCSPSAQFCASAGYSWTIIIRDECGLEILKQSKNEGKINAGCSTVNRPAPWSQTLPAGSYLITKVLTVRPGAVDSVVTKYIGDPRNWMCKVPPVTGKPDCDMIKCDLESVHVDVDSLNQLGYRIPNINYLPRPRLVDTKECVPIEFKGECRTKLAMMLANMSPGGQYASFPNASPEDTNSDIYSYPLSVLNEKNSLDSKGNWRVPVTPYRHSNGEEIFINKNGKPVRPEQLSDWTEFIANWEPSMAYSLLPYHPEYCYYEWCIKNAAMFDYSDVMLSITNAKDASRRFPKLFNNPQPTVDSDDPLMIRYPGQIPFMLSLVKDLMLLDPTTRRPVSMSELARIAAAGFSPRADSNRVLEYLRRHTIYSKAHLADDEWNQFKTYYLQARQEVIARVRRFGGDDNCRDNIKIGDRLNGGLYASKIPLFPSRSQLQIFLPPNVPTPNPTNASVCGNCTEAQGLLTFLNMIIEQKSLLTTSKLHGSVLSTIASEQTDEAISQDSTITWSVGTSSATNFYAKLTSELGYYRTLELSLKSSKHPLQWKDVKVFNCFKALDSGKFSITAYDKAGYQFDFTGKTDIVVMNRCPGAGPPNIDCQPKPYADEFVSLTKSILDGISNNQIKPSILYDPINTGNELFDLFANSVWSVPVAVNITTPDHFDIPLLVENPATGKVRKLTIKIDAADPNLLNAFAGWVVKDFALVQLNVIDTCVNGYAIKIVIEKNGVQSSLLASVKDLPLGRCCDQEPDYCCMPMLPDNWPQNTSPTCLEIFQAGQRAKRELFIAQTKKEQEALIRRAYWLHCLKPVETLSLRYTPTEYHFTLSYYDQAGNLTKTIPPAGVKLLKGAELTAVQNYRDKTGGYKPSGHGMASRFKYDSQNEMVTTMTPDTDSASFGYDRKRQLRLSQNGQQRKEGKFSFIRYDGRGRVIQSGQFLSSASFADLAKLIDNPDFPARTYQFTDVTSTFYDVATRKDQDVIQAGLKQENLLNRVSFTSTCEEESRDSVVTYYSYDMHGTVKSLLQKIPALEPKRTDYRYDLVSGKVNEFIYQGGKQDQFLHKFTYDTDNRIREVSTSSDGILWQKDARYEYYLHGPLARVELGHFPGSDRAAAQGLDYYYTLQGWLKGINMPIKDDPGKDGETGTHNEIGQDVFSTALGYYKNDYGPIGTAAVVDGRDRVWDEYYAARHHNGFYNGNIGWMITDIASFQDRTQAMLYNYDQLHRLVKTESRKRNSAGSPLWSRTGAYNEDFSYDENGNLKTLLRKDQLGTFSGQLNYDSLTYRYYSGTNRLRYPFQLKRDVVYKGWIPQSKMVHTKVRVAGSARVRPGQDIVIKAIDSVDFDNNFRQDTTGGLRAYVLDENEGAYNYDANGNIIADQYEGLLMTWTPNGKLRSVVREDSTRISFRYDAAGNRVQKDIMKKDGSLTSTKYILDGSGNVMAIYDDEKLVEQHVYGGSRVGVYRGGQTPSQLRLGLKNYELNNHLGNVITVISDEVHFNQGKTSATVLSARDYYAFGSVMKGRETNFDLYRYGFNKQESVNEISGSGNHNTALFWEYDTRVARRWNIDRVTPISMSPFAVMLDNPLKFNDVFGNVSNEVTKLNEVVKINNKTYLANSNKTMMGRNEKNPTNRVTVITSDDVAKVVGWSQHIIHDHHGTVEEATLGESNAWSGSGTELDFKNKVYELLEMNKNDLLEIDGVLYNPNEAGNYLWALSLEYAGSFISPNLIGQVGSLIHGRLDEEHDQQAISRGRAKAESLYGNQQFSGKVNDARHGFRDAHKNELENKLKQIMPDKSEFKEKNSKNNSNKTKSEPLIRNDIRQLP